VAIFSRSSLIQRLSFTLAAGTLVLIGLLYFSPNPGLGDQP